MVLGAAQPMGGCGDALFTALVLPAAVFSSPRPTPRSSANAATAAAVYIFVSLIKLPLPLSAIHRIAVGPVTRTGPMSGEEQEAMNYENLNIKPPCARANFRNDEFNGSFLHMHTCCLPHETWFG
jgi:hypothetical protein